MNQKTFDLAQFNQYKEGNRLEVKKAKDGLPKSLWETYSSFSNCEGGIIILGVGEREDGSWYTVGLQNSDKLLKDFWNCINDPSKVSVNLLKRHDVKIYNINEDTVITIQVPRADRVNKPVYINNDLFGGTYRRDHEGDYHCTKSEVRGMLRDQTEQSIDARVIENMDLDVFYSDTIKSFRTRHSAVSPDHVWHKLSDELYLERIGAVSTYTDGKLHPTVAGLLMFGEEFKIRLEFPEYFVDYREMLDPLIRWTDRLESSSGEWSGNLFDFFIQMERKLLRDLKRPFQLNGFTRIDETPVHKAVREALANCIVNADFNFSQGIVIRKDPNSIVIENPGSILTGKVQMLKGGVSEPRNKTIMKMFNLIRVGERAGSGVPSILKVWEESGWILPTVEERYKPDRTILTLSFETKTSGKQDVTTRKLSKNSKSVKSKTSAKSTKLSKKNETKTSGKQDVTTRKLSKNLKSVKSKTNTKSTKLSKKNEAKTTKNKSRISQFLSKHRKAKTSQIAEYIGLSEARTRVMLSELIELGVIRSEGTGRARFYVLNK